MNDKKISIRPQISTIKTRNNITEIESFQNNTLRPILKLQHSLLLLVFKHYALSHKVDLQNISNTTLEVFIKDSLSKDTKLKTLVAGICIGQFTTDEYCLYITNPSEYNKRITAMLTKRWLDSLEEITSL